MVKPYAVVPLSSLRKVIAARMTEAKRNIPHFRLVSSIEMDALLALREWENFARSNDKASVNDCLVKMCACALIEHGEINIQLGDTALHRYHQVDIAVVITIDGGLATPMVRNANTKSVWEIAAEIKALTARHRQAAEDGRDPRRIPQHFESRWLRRRSVRCGHQSSSVCHPDNRACQTTEGDDRECRSARGEGFTRHIVGASSCNTINGALAARS